MAAMDERVALLEGRMLEQANVFADIRETLRSLDQRLTGLDQKVDHSITSLHQSMGTVHQSMGTVHQSIGTLHQSMETLPQLMATGQQSVVATLYESLAALRGEAATDFKWLVGIQVTTLVAVVAALLGALAAG